jgi:hypothetical protein
MKYLKLFESFGKKLYHGNRKGDFPPEKKRFAGSIFLTSNLEFAKDFAGYDERETFPDGAVWEVSLKPGLKLCNPMDRKVMGELNLKGTIQKMIDDKYIDPVSGTKFNEVSYGFKGYDYVTDKEFDIKDKSEAVYFYLWRIKNGAWRVIECDPIIKSIKDSGYDGFIVVERGNENVAIFSEDVIENFVELKE